MTELVTRGTGALGRQVAKMLCDCERCSQSLSRRLGARTRCNSLGTRGRIKLATICLFRRYIKQRLD